MPESTKNIIERYRTTGRVVFTYPKLKMISLNGGARMPEVEARKKMLEVLNRQSNPAGYTTTTTAMPYYHAARREAKQHPERGANEGLKYWLGTLPATRRAKAQVDLRTRAAVEAWHTGWVSGQQAYGVSQAAGKRQTAVRNPESTAADAYESFHGKPSDEILEFETTEHVHENLAAAGELIELQILITQGKRRNRLLTVNFEGCGVLLTFDENVPGGWLDKARNMVDMGAIIGGQLYFTGGDQSVPLEEFGMSDATWVKDCMVLGELRMVTYRTQKSFDDFDTIDYFHKVGEVTHVYPLVTYKPGKPNQGVPPSLHLAGGQYTVEKRGIVN